MRYCEHCGNKKVGNVENIFPPDQHNPLDNTMDTCLSSLIINAKNMLEAINEARMTLKPYLEEDEYYNGFLAEEARKHLNHLSSLEDAAQEIEGYIDHHY